MPTLLLTLQSLNQLETIHSLPAENPGLRFGGADSHACCFKLGCKSSLGMQDGHKVLSLKK